MSTQIASPVADAVDALRDVRVLIVEAHEPTRLGLAMLLQRESWTGRCYLAADRESAVELTRRHRPHVALVEVATIAPFQSIVGNALRAAFPHVKLVFTSRCATSASNAMERACGAGFVPPEASGSAVVDIVRDVVTGRIQDPAEPRSESIELTGRERDVLSLLSTGATNREIAAIMHLGPDAVKKNATAIYRKLGVRNRTEATQRALELLTH